MAYQPYLNRIDLFKKLGIKVTWRTLLIGLMGPGKFLAQLTTQEIIDYACDFLDKEDVAEEVIELISCSKDDKDEIKTILNRLADKENTNFGEEELKWQVALLSVCLEKISQKAMYGMIELTEFWEKFGYPKNCPHIIQGKNNNLSPNEYFSNDFFNQMIIRHREWISQQIKGLGK